MVPENSQCILLSCNSQNWGTEMNAGSRTFFPHPGTVIRDLFRQLYAVWHGMEAVVYCNHPRRAAASFTPRTENSDQEEESTNARQIMTLW